MRRIAIVGTREPTPEQYECVRDLVRSLAVAPDAPNITIVSGGARGVDSIAAYYSKRLGLTTVEYPADWATHGKAAGYSRNQTIVDDCDEVHAFPGAGRGTWDTIARARKAGKPVTVHGDVVEPARSR